MILPMTESPPVDRWRWLRRLAPWVISGAVVAGLLYQYPIDRIIAEAARGDTLAMAPVAAVMIGVLWFLVTFSDRLFMESVLGPIGFADLMRSKAGVSVLNGLGLAANYGGYGLWIQRRFRCRAGTAAGMVTYITLCDLAAVSMLGSAAIWLGDGVPADARDRLGIVVPVVAAAAVALLLLRPRREGKSFLDPWRRIPLRNRLVGLGVRTVQLAILILSTWIAARAFGMPVPFGPMTSYLPVLMVIGALPINVAGFGPIQAAWVAAYSAYAPGEQILAFYFLWHLLVLVALVLRGAPFLRRVVAEIERRQ
jgi:hypothetical protein